MGVVATGTTKGLLLSAYSFLGQLISLNQFLKIFRPETPSLNDKGRATNMDNRAIYSIMDI